MCLLNAPDGYIVCDRQSVSGVCVYVCGNGVNKHIVGEVTEAKVKQRLQSIPPGCVCVCVCVCVCLCVRACRQV